MLTGRTYIMDLPVTAAQIEAYYNGQLLQEAFPSLDVDQREFIKSGITKEEWEAVYGPDTEENTVQDLVSERP
jgi:hypothetical protein